MGFTYADRTTVEERSNSRHSPLTSLEHTISTPGSRDARTSAARRSWAASTQAWRKQIASASTPAATSSPAIAGSALLVERGQLAPDMVRPLRHLEAEPPRDERRWLAVRQVVEIGSVRAPDLEDVAEPGCREQRRPGAASLGHRVDHDRGAVHEDPHRPGRDVGSREDVEHTTFGSRGHGVGLRQVKRPGRLVHGSEIGEGPADVDADAMRSTACCSVQHEGE